jgi:hypothetical protein
MSKLEGSLALAIRTEKIGLYTFLIQRKVLIYFTECPCR